MLDLDDEVVRLAAKRDIALDPVPYVRPTQLHGIEVNRYAAELAQVVVWIGYLQWMHVHGIDNPRRPILDKLQTIENRDAILDLTDKRNPRPADWPEAEFIIGNPPFLGSKLFREQGLSDAYLAPLWGAYDLPRSSDLCCYWFEQARRRVPSSVRVGLLATQGIRGGDNREVLNQVKGSGDIFMAWSDREWVLDGAAVHVSIIGFDGGNERERMLDGHPVESINSNLRTDVDTTKAVALRENAGTSFMGSTKGGSFELDWHEARIVLAEPNPVPASNLDVVRPWANGKDLTQRTAAKWIIGFGSGTAEAEASKYEAPYRVVAERVRPARQRIRQERESREWWLHVRTRADLYAKLAPLQRFLGTARVSKHRLFPWLTHPTLPDCQVIAFARADDYFLGVLQGSVHD